MFEELIHLPTWFWLSFFGLLGLCLGSFANVIVVRLPQGKSIISPRSHCTQCKTPVKWIHNIPVVSWLVLRGKCAYCEAMISWRYPVIELLMGLVFVSLYAKLGLSWFLLECLVLCFGLVTVSFIDFEHMILPDVFTLSGIVIGLVGGALNPEREFLSALFGVLMGGGFLWAVAWLYYLIRKQDGMGGGDIKLLAWLGAVLGWKSIPFVILASCIFGSFIGVAMSFKQKEGMQAAIPFGPYLALGGLLYILAGEELSAWYLSIFLPGL